jgi:large conductance mechanosensitive channel
MLNEFKEFAMKGNVVDLAVAVVIGAAFGRIVTSLVADIITPLIGVLLGGIDFSSLTYQVGEATLTYGVFVQAIIDFIIVAFAIFLVVKGINRARAADRKPEPEATETPAEPAEDIKLLREIRDAVQKRNS